MTIRFACPHCQEVWHAPNKGAGKVKECPNCGRQFQVPAAPAVPLASPIPSPADPRSVQPPGGGPTSTTPVRPAPSGISTPPPVPRVPPPGISPVGIPAAAPQIPTTAGQAPSAPKNITTNSEIVFACPACKRVLQAQSGQAGSKLFCPKCGQRLQVPAPPASSARTALEQPGPLPLACAPVQPSGFQPPGPQGFIPPEEIVPMEEVAPRRRSRHDKGRRRARQEPSSLGPALAGCGGLLLLIIGLFVVLFFWLFYDTSVPVYPGYPELDRVHNVGLMQNRLIGIIVGFGILAVGLTLTLVGMIAGRKPK